MTATSGTRLSIRKPLVVSVQFPPSLVAELNVRPVSQTNIFSGARSTILFVILLFSSFSMLLATDIKLISCAAVLQRSRFFAANRARNYFSCNPASLNKTPFLDNTACRRVPHVSSLRLIPASLSASVHSTSRYPHLKARASTNNRQARNPP